MKNKILLIHSQEETLKIIREAILSEFDLDNISDTKKAKKLINENNYNVILIENDLDKLSAIDILKKLNSLSLVTDTPIVVITDISENEKNIIELFNQGITDFIKKPLNQSELLLRIKYLISFKNKIKKFEKSLLMSGSLIDNLEKNLSTIEDLKGQLESENQKLNKVSKLKENLIATTLHDLKAPFSAIMGNCQLLENGYLGDLNEEQKDSINTINKSAGRLLSIINDILDTSKIESGKMDLTVSEVDIPFIVEFSINELYPLINEKNLDLKMNYENNLPRIYIDVEKIIRVLNNLIFNAIKYSSPNTELIIKAEKLDAEHIKISVIDQGEGIPDEDLERIFEVYEQSSRAKPGTGLGLSICKSIIEMHNGTIFVESKLGVGSTFYFTLPINLYEAESL